VIVVFESDDIDASYTELDKAPLLGKQRLLRNVGLIAIRSDNVLALRPDGYLPN